MYLPARNDAESRAILQRCAPDYIRGFEVERLYRDAKITQIYEGTNRIQRTIIGRDLLERGNRPEALHFP